MLTRNLFVAQWAYDLMIRDLVAQDLPATHEQLLAEAEKVVGPVTIEVYDSQ